MAHKLFDPGTLLGAVLLGILFLAGATVLAALLRKGARRIEDHLSDATGLAFASALGQVLAYIAAFVLYARLVPQLRTLGTTLLAGVSIVSVVIGLAAQNTLANLIAGFTLVLYRPITLGDRVQISTPKGLVTATVETLSLGYTVLRDDDRHQILVPNGVMMSSVVIRLERTRDESQAAGG